MLQDIAPHILTNDYRTTPQPGDLLMRFDGDRVQLPFSRCGDFPEAEKHYAFSLDGTAVWLTEGTGDDFVGSRDFREMEPPELAFACCVGESLHRWHRANRFCGCCGGKMHDSRTERAVVCGECGHIVYPRINPAVIVAVTDGDRLLLTKYAHRTFKRYALVAGFCEAGETVEQCVAREVWEETGLRVKNLRFYKSQPWVVTDSLLFGFYCDVDGSTQTTLRDGELALAQWFHRDRLPADFSRISLTGEMIARFGKGMEPKTPDFFTECE